MDAKILKGEITLKVRKKISEVVVLSGDTPVPLTELLDKYVANIMDEVEISLTDGEMYAIYVAQRDQFRLQ